MQNINVTFHFRDGSTRKTLKGYTIPLNDETKCIYDLIMSFGNSKNDKTA